MFTHSGYRSNANEVAGVGLILWSLVVALTVVSWAAAADASGEGADPVTLLGAAAYVAGCFLSGYALVEGARGGLPLAIGLLCVAPAAAVFGISSTIGLLALGVSAVTAVAIAEGLRA